MSKNIASVATKEGISGETCFLPDQYAIIWAWNGSGDIMSYNPITKEWEYYGKTTLPDGSTLGGFSMDVDNNLNDPKLVFQRGGTLYTAPLDNPTQLTVVGTSNNPAFSGSYPCGAFDPAGRYLIGIGSGSTVGEVNMQTGAVTTIGTLKDNRDGAPLQAGPGDWYFDPAGNWFLMARDIRGASFGVSTGTVKWQIDPATLCAVRLSNTAAPTSGTGAAWLSAGQDLLSTSNQIYVYNQAVDSSDPTPSAWDNSVIPNAPYRINDLGNQWVVPKPIPLLFCTEKNKADRISDFDFYEIKTDDETFETTVGPEPFVPTVPGSWNKKNADPNPFVTDPFSPSNDDEKPVDKVWHEGCSDAGVVMWREDCNGLREYIVNGITTNAAPTGFDGRPCGSIFKFTNTVPFCLSDDNQQPVKTIYQQTDTLTKEVVWFDETGEIAEPSSEDIEAGECPPGDEETTVSDQIVCYENNTYIRRRTDNLADNGTGLLEPINYEISIFNSDGVLYSSGVTPIADPPSPVEPDFTVGECQAEFIDYDAKIMCEIDARFLLLIDSGGAFARYSFLTKKWVNVSTLSVSSAGGSADVENFRLYNFVAPNQITVIDVNTDTQLPNLTVTDGVIKPGLVTNPKTFSAASFRSADGKLYAWDTGGADAGLYCVNVQTGVIDFVTTVSGVSGTGTSIMIDNTTDTLIFNGSNLSYAVDWTNGTSSVWGNPPIRPNGGTFDTEGNAYVTEGNNTYCLPTGADPNIETNWVQIIDDWTPGANSIAYYEVKAPFPAEFECRFGITANGERISLGTFETLCGNENLPRKPVGEIVPCSYVERQKLCEIAENTLSGGGSTSALMTDGAN